MEEIVVKEVDPQGRISIPVKWRKGWGTRRLALVRRKDRIEIFALESLPPSELFDSIRISEAGGEVDIADTHSVKRALSEKGEQ